MLRKVRVVVDLAVNGGDADVAFVNAKRFRLLRSRVLHLVNLNYEVKIA